MKKLIKLLFYIGFLPIIYILIYKFTSLFYYIEKGSKINFDSLGAMILVYIIIYPIITGVTCVICNLLRKGSKKSKLVVAIIQIISVALIFIINNAIMLDTYNENSNDNMFLQGFVTWVAIYIVSMINCLTIYISLKIYKPKEKYLVINNEFKV